jgi:hypothetical protein
MPRITSNLESRRKAAILFITVVLLTLFLVIGLCFILFADAQATSARVYREANNNIADILPTITDMANAGFSSLIYDANDDPSGMYSAMRGHSIGRDMYGWRYFVNNANQVIDANASGIPFNGTPFNGSGALHTGGALAMNPWGLDDAMIPSYVYYASDGFKRDPERFTLGPQPYNSNSPNPVGVFTGGMNTPYTAPDMNHLFLAAMDSNGNVTLPSFWRGDQIGFRPPPAWPNGTWPSPAPTLSPGTAINPNITWQDPTLPPYYKYMSLRPRPADQLKASEPQTLAQVQALLNSNQIFPMPKTFTDPVTNQVYNGDVANLPGNAQHYDSIWMDLGFPVYRLASSGVLIKPMFAYLVVDLDGRVNYNVSGNVREAAPAAGQGTGVGYGYHASMQGLGPWEINPRQLMPQTNNPLGAPPTFPAGGDANEYLNLFRGVSGNSWGGRYGILNNLAIAPDAPPPGPGPGVPVPSFPYPSRSAPKPPVTNVGYEALQPSGSALTKNYSKFDFNGSSWCPTNPSGGNMSPMAMPAANTFTAFPSFPKYFESASLDERYVFPGIYNPFNLNQPPTTPPSLTAANTNQLFPIGDIQGLIAWSQRLSAVSPGNPFPISPDTVNTQIGQLWPTNIRNYPKLRFQLTPYSMDMDRPGAAPGQPTSPLTLDTTLPPGINRIPQGAATTFQSLLPNRIANPNPGGDLIANDWRSILPALGRVDLNRPLTAYPVPAVAGKPVDFTQPGVSLQYQKAVRDRVFLARDIFSRLVAATGADNPANYTGSDFSGNQQFEALRYLAQISANIVDYVDDDDVITAFNFLGDQLNAASVPAWGWVYGTEMPRLVLNEAYAQIENNPNDQFNASLGYMKGGQSDPNAPIGTAFPAMVPMGAKATNKFRVNFFVELHNPHNTDPNAFDNGNAWLQFSDGSGAIYKVVVQSQVDSVATRAANNLRGDPQPPAASSNPKINIQVQNFTTDNTASNHTAPKYFVAPANGAYSATNSSNDSGNNTGYYVIGPATTGNGGFQDATAQPQFPNDHSTTSPWDFWGTTAISGTISSTPTTPSTTLAMDLDQTDPTNDPSVIAAAPANTNPNCPAVFLQRLVNPYLPPQTDITKPLYNPYVTIDYIEHVQINDATLYSNTGPRNGQMGNPKLTDLASRFSVGRRQPFKASVVTQQSPNPALTTSAQQTFFSQNGQSQAAPGTTLDNPFNWLVFGDRRLISPAELLHVSAYKPHELTQEFMNPNYAGLGGPQQAAAHQIPWRTATTRLYRAFELMGANGVMNNQAFGARVPGKININDPAGQEVLNALCDPDVNGETRHYFNQTTVNNIWTNLQNPTTGGPFWGSTVPYAGTTTPDGQYPPPQGVPVRTGPDDTLLRSGFFQVSGGANDSYVQEELLKKIANNVTTRSNVFGVFLTTGFFVVRDASTSPVKLGQEFNPTLRHKLFAVVDRTNLSVLPASPTTQGDRPIYFPLVPTAVGGAPESNVITAGASTAVIQLSTAYAAGTITPQLHYVIVRDTIDHFGNSYSPFVYNLSGGSGRTSQIIEGQGLYLDTGSGMEIVKVISVQPNPGTPGNSLITIQPQNATNKFQFNHYAGCAFCTAMLGFPGPQQNFDWTSEPYVDTVLPFRIQLQ